MSLTSLLTLTDIIEVGWRVIVVLLVGGSPGRSYEGRRLTGPGKWDSTPVPYKTFE